MKIYQSRVFENKTKKLSKKEKEILDNEIKRIIENPFIGEQKKGDLRDIYIHKFKIKSIEHFLSYRMIRDGLELIMIGQQENYYRELKSYIKES